MALLNRLKRMFTNEKLVATSIKVLAGGQDSFRSSFSPLAASASYRSWVYAAANLNAAAVASSPLRLYIRRASKGRKPLWNTAPASRRMKSYLAGGLAQTPSHGVMQKAAEYGDEYEVVNDNHPILDLLTNVNPYQNGYDATVLRILYLELTGNAYLHPVIDERLGIPRELWTMPSQWIEIVAGKTQFIDGYFYGATREQRRLFAVDEVIHFKRPNPSDLYYGLGKVEAAWGAIQMNQAAHEMDLSFFENKARPDYLLSLKSDVSAEEVDRLQTQIDEKLRGARREGRFLTTNAEVTLNPLSFPPKDLTGRDEVVEEIAAIFGVPVSMLKANDPNLASATAGYAMWRETTILPLLRMDEEVLNQKLLPLFGIERDAFLCYDNPVPADARFDLEQRRTATAGGWRTANEARIEEGREPIDDPKADQLLVNGIPLGGQPAPAPFGSPMAASIDAIDDKASPLAPTLGMSSAQVQSLIDVAMKSRRRVKALTLEEIDLQPTEAMASNAERGLALREEFNRGGTAVGVARARDIKNRARLSPDTVGRMVSYFARHEVDKQGEGFRAEQDGYPSAGLIAWLLWGGDSGKAWADSKWRAIKRARNDEEKSQASKKERIAIRKSCDCSACSDPSDALPPRTYSLKTMWDDVAEDEEREIHTKAKAGELSEFEAKLARAVDKVLQDQVAAVLRKLKGVTTPTAELIAEIEVLLASAKWDRELVAVMRPYLKDAIASGTAIGSAAIEKLVAMPSFVPDKSFLDAYIETESTKLSRRIARSVNTTTTVRVQDLLGNGLQEGKTIPQLADSVQDWAGKAGDAERSTRSRAVTVARTEAQRAMQSAEIEAWKSTGLVEGKTWLLAPAACPFCTSVAKAFGKKAIALEESFFAKGEEIEAKDGSKMILDYGDISHPPLHPNCRCSLQPRLVDDYETIVRDAEKELPLGAWIPPEDR